jgi:hypothetical protein
MQKLTIEAKSPESAIALLDALRLFGGTPATDDHGRYLISLEIGTDEHALEVLDAVREHFACRVGDAPLSVLAVGVEEDRYSVHDR